MNITEQQKEICEKYSTNFQPSEPRSKVGISLNVKAGEFPIHGLRHHSKGDTNGWYIWAGEYLQAVDFFQPLHVEHILEWNPMILKYLGLPPGYRFLIAPSYEDVWFDADLLNEE